MLVKNISQSWSWLQVEGFFLVFFKALNLQYSRFCRICSRKILALLQKHKKEAQALNNQMSIPHLVQVVLWHIDMGEHASVLSHSQRLNVYRKHLGSLQVSQRFAYVFAYPNIQHAIFFDKCEITWPTFKVVEYGSVCFILKQH